MTGLSLSLAVIFFILKCRICHFRLMNEFISRNAFQGYRVVSVDIPRVWNHHEWIQAFEKFLDAINVHHVRNLQIFYCLFYGKSIYSYEII